MKMRPAISALSVLWSLCEWCHRDHEVLAHPPNSDCPRDFPDQRDPGVQPPGGPGQLAVDAAEGQNRDKWSKHHRGRAWQNNQVAQLVLCLKRVFLHLRFLFQISSYLIDQQSCQWSKQGTWQLLLQQQQVQTLFEESPGIIIIMCIIFGKLSTVFL